jgi:cytochrome c peroxidase
LALVAAMLLGCQPVAIEPDGGASPDAAEDDPDPSFTAAERTALAMLRYDDGPPPADPSNRFADDAAARALGHRLFFETALSGPLLEGDNDGSLATLGVVGEAERVSCAGCHVPAANFVDSRSNHRQISLGSQWTRRRSPTVLEVGFAPLYNWDGRRDSLWSQAIGVMESDVEFNSGRLFVAEQIFRRHRTEYEAVFGALPPLDDEGRFPALTGVEAGCRIETTLDGPVRTCRGLPGDEADYDAMAEEDQRVVTEVVVNVAKALAAYLRVLRCGPGRFDAWLDGDETALTRSEQRGAALFVGRAGCVSCHDGPLLTDQRFHNVGLRPAPVAVAFTDLDDRGAGEGIALLAGDPLSSTGAFSDGAREAPPAVTAELEGAFRTPTLRCIAGQPSFMHTGQLRRLEEVVAFFARGGDSYGYPGTSEIHALDLSERERADVTAFLSTLEGPGPDAVWLEPPP